MDVARKVAEVFSAMEAAAKVAIFAHPDGADSIAAYGILKMLLFYCRRDVEAYTDCTSAEIVHHHLTAAEDKEVGMLFLVNCYHETVEEAVRQLPRLSETAIVVLDSRWARRRRTEGEDAPLLFLGGTEEDVLRRVHERSQRLELPCHRYHGTPAALCAYHLCISMTPSFRHPSVLWRAMVGCADLYQRKRIHRDQYIHLHEYLMQEVESSSEQMGIEESHETCLHFFQQSNLWDALHMSPHLYEKFDASGFEDFIANALGFPQHIAEYSYYQFVTGPGREIWSELQTAGNLVGVQDLVLPGFQKTFHDGYLVHAMDHALAVNLALWHLRAKQHRQETICIHDIFWGGEEAMGKPQDTIPRYVEILKSDCDSRRQKTRRESLE